VGEPAAPDTPPKTLTGTQNPGQRWPPWRVGTHLEAYALAHGWERAGRAREKPARAGGFRGTTRWMDV